MTDEPTTDAPEEEELDPFKIEPARSSRSRCKTCKRKIDKDILRIGILIEGPFGTGYLWHHLKCAAKRNFEAVEEAYEQKLYPEGVELPTLESLKKHADDSAKKKAERRDPPYAEADPSGRAKCKHCDEKIEKGSMRVILGRNVEFYRQVRVAAINVHPKCVAAEMMAEDCATEPEGFADALRENSRGVEKEQLDTVLAEIGELI